MKVFISLFCFVSVLAVLLGFAFYPKAAVSQASKTSAAPIIVELFTSQACAFCPPADALLGGLIKNKNIIGLSCHVSYFDVKEKSFGKKFCTDRQTRYVKQFPDVQNHYTPQMVINGHRDVIGYETGKVQANLLKAHGDGVKPIMIVPQKSGENIVYSLTLPPISAQGKVDLTLMIFDQIHEMSPKTRGRYAGKPRNYHHVVSRMSALGVWNGTHQRKIVAPLLTVNNAGFAILAQDSKTGRILAAGQYQTP